MKMSVILLTVFGLIAAVCAAVLVQTMVRRPAPVAKAETDPDITLLVAAAPLKMMTIVESGMVVSKTVRKSEVPLGAMTNSVQVIGKILTRPMQEGEAFAPSCFANEGKGLYLAGALPYGKRAFSVSLRDHSGMAGILYPGSIVDVLVSMQASGSEKGVATTLLQGIQVMGIGSQTVASEQEYENKTRGALASKGDQNYRMVTLLVTPKQAEILQLATQYGTVALTMRNPRDNQQVAQRLTKVSEFAGAARGFGENLASWAALMAQRRPQTPARSGPPDLFAAAPTTKPVEETNPLWEMLVVRGNTSEKRSFPLSEVNQESPAEDEVQDASAPPSKPEPAAGIIPAPPSKG